MTKFRTPTTASQPRGTTLQPIPKDETVRAGLYLEQQKFVPAERANQLPLFDEPGETISQGLVDTGLNLTVSEDKALAAIQVLFSETGYDGDCPPRTEYVDEYKQDFALPRRSFTWSDYYEAYGVKRRDGKYQGKAARIAREALLDGLQRPRTVMYERTYEEDGERRSTIIRSRMPLVRILEALEGLNEREARRVRAGEELSHRVTKLYVEASPLMIDGIESFYMLRPKRFHQEIEHYTGGKRVSAAVPDFLNWLLTLNINPMTIRKETLAKRLRPLRSISERREQKLLDTRIQECLEIAKGLNYLTDYSESEEGLLTLHLNPDRCRRASKRRGRRRLPEAASPTADGWVAPSKQEEPNREKVLPQIRSIVEELKKPTTKRKTR